MKNEGGGTRQHLQKNQQTSDDFQHSGKAVERQQMQLVERLDVRDVKQLSGPVLKLKTACNHAQ